MKAALYARFSSDLQREASIEDQFRVCRDFAAREGHIITADYADRGISAASMFLRPDLNRLLSDAHDRRFEVLIVEAIDRLSRNQRDMADIFQNLAFCGIPILSVSEGLIDEMHVGFKGTMNAMYRKDLAFKVKRGQKGRLEAGRVPAGLCYGYEVGPGTERGIRVINPEKSVIIREIYDAYISGQSPRAIAKDLNARNIPGPTGKTWGPSSINGNRKRASGILENPIYVGQVIYGRQSFIVDPRTGKTAARVNPRDTWTHKPFPELAIVSQAQWDAVRERKARHADKPARNIRKYLMSGLIKCSVCGGSYTSIGDGRFGCSQHKDRGTCANKKRVKVADVDARVLSALKSHLLDPRYITTFVEECRREWAKLTGGHDAERKRLSGQQKGLETKIARLIRMIEQGTQSESITGQITERERELRDIKDKAAALPNPDIAPIPDNLTHIWASILGDLDTALRKDSIETANTLLRGIVETITLTPTPEGYTLNIGGLVGRGSSIPTRPPIFRFNIAA